MLLNKEKLMYAFDNIRKNTDAVRGGKPSMAWLIMNGGKCAVLIVCEKNDGEDCLLFDIDGRLLYQHHYDDIYGEYYYEVLCFFEKYDGYPQTDAVLINNEKYTRLITDTKNNLEYMFRYCRDRQWMTEALNGGRLSEIKYLCTIFKLNSLYGISTDDIPDSFYLRFGIINDSGGMSYYDTEYIVPDDTENDDFLYIDEFIMDTGK